MKLPYVIGLTGLKRSGKDTVARHLCEHHGFLAFSWADPIKAMLRTMGVPEEHLTGERKEELVPGLGVSGRHLMQTLGTEWGRDLISRDLWVFALQHSQAFQGAMERSPVVIPDCRFANEAQAVRALGGQVWAIVRPGLVSDGHASELGLPSDEVDRFLCNDSTIENLCRQADWNLAGQPV